MVHFSDWSTFQMMQFFLPRVFFAVVCGGLIGLERELRNKAAGIKTNMLICLGSAIYASISIVVSTAFEKSGYYGDPSRISAQIVSGIGFLGGGAIVQARGTILGLTTAATIWVVAAIGICVGLGYWLFSVAVSAVVVAVLIGVRFVENRVLGKLVKFEIEVIIRKTAPDVKNQVRHSLEKFDLVVESFDVYTIDGHERVRLRYEGYPNNNKQFLMELWSVAGIDEVKTQVGEKNEIARARFRFR